MRTTQRWMVLGALVLFAAFVACTGNGIDDGDAADVVLEVVNLQTPAVTGTLETGECAIGGNPCLGPGDCQGDGNFCDIEIGGEGCQVANWSLQLRNVPVSVAAATSPFNDIVVSSISAEYRSVLGALLWERTFPVSCTIAPNTTGTCAFGPITFDDLTLDNVTLNIFGTLHAQTVGGETVETDFGAQLNIEACLAPALP